MKRTLLSAMVLLGVSAGVHAENLLDIYQQAQIKDTQLLESKAKRDQAFEKIIFALKLGRLGQAQHLAQETVGISDRAVRTHGAEAHRGVFDIERFEIGRARRPLMAFVAVLSWSRQIFLRFYLGAHMENFLRGHVHAFAFFQGQPRVIL